MLTKNGSDLVKVLNNNMRCFEMSATSSPAFQAMELNNNMRCFEIAHNSMWFNFTPMLNNNMRCFEIGTEVF